MIFKSTFINILLSILILMNTIEATEIVNDEYAVKILLETLRHPSNIMELSYKLDIPLAECSKRIKVLEQNRLIYCVYMELTQYGRTIPVYVSNQKNTYTLLRNFTDELENFVSDLRGTEETQIETY